MMNAITRERVDGGIPRKLRQAIARHNGRAVPPTRQMQSTPAGGSPPTAAFGAYWKAQAKELARQRWKALPGDQRFFSYPLAWGRTGCMFMAYALGVLNAPSWCFYQAARGLNWCGQHYPLIRSFVIAHAAGSVSRGLNRKRLVQCVGCDRRYIYQEHAFCRTNCKCGHWRLARLSYKTGLSGWQCPIDKFGLGRFGEWQRRVLGRFFKGANDGNQDMDRR